MMVEYKEIYNAIVIEFQLSSSILEELKSEVEILTKSRMELCNLLKITKFSVEDLDVYEKEFIKNIDINKSKIRSLEKEQIDLKNKIKQSKQEIKAVKLLINKLENKIVRERAQSKRYNQALRIFLKREKFKFIKKILFKSYRKVFFKYSTELSIKTKIVQCNKRKEKIRQEKQQENNCIEKHKRKIIVDKVALANMTKCIINMEKRIEFFLVRIQSLEDYKKVEKKFRVESQQYHK
ncbi:hypothetical protein G9F72_014595 [Clostridium estertheticum]|uniref:hypothetical protein n=1 Tax=Clostridium estertheticum TaxID=238834 RepID=UPI0013E96194|nr:hypothetical protein [Clostridium estertheticum]MBZ9687558.1 hypothetical protein [Clostridium estertheticum]